MDKYEFNIKAEQISRLVEEGDYGTAMQIADTIDWRRVRNANLLSSIADIYDRNGEYEEAKDILMLAFERAPVGKRFLFRLSELSLKAGDIPAAQEFYNEFCDVSPEDDQQYLLRFLILRAKGAKAEQLAGALEMYTSTELDEKWLYELARLYAEAGNPAAAVQTCDRIVLMFGIGDYVQRALELKQQFQTLSPDQQALLTQPTERAAAPAPAAEAAEETEVFVPAENDAAAAEDNAFAPELPAAATYVSAPAEESIMVPAEEVPEAPAAEDNAFVPETAAVSAVQDEADDIFEEVSETEEAPAPKFDTYHMIIEAKTAEDGFRIAKDEIKYFHEKYGVSYKVAKTNAEKLNAHGFAAFVDKIAGKDLIIENAGSLTYSVVDELSAYIEHPKDSASVVLVDTVDRFDRMAEDRPLFIKAFDLVSDVEKKDEIEDVDLEQESAPAVPTYTESAAAPVREETPALAAASTERPARPYDAQPAVQTAAEEDYAEPELPSEAEDEEMPAQAEDEANSAAEAPETASDGQYSRLSGIRLDVDAFANYAQAYAHRIDCVIPGKAVLALYERVEMMEEDGVPLTRENAEQLIEEAADLAEKPSLGKKLTGMLHPKYDKEGKLILREENFLNA